MLPEIKNYLEEVHSHLYLRPEVERQLVNELESHLQEKITDLKKQGFSEEAATSKAIESFGKPDKVARLLYEACSKGSWVDALKFSLPHFLIAALFASSMLHKPVVAIPVFVLIVTVTIFGWRNGKPDWLYSWAGYAIIPLFAGMFLLAPTVGQLYSAIMGNGPLPSTGLILLVIVCFSFSGWLITRVSIRVVKRDWLIASLMLVPIPIIGCWLFHMQQIGGFLGGFEFVHLDQPISQAIFVLGITSVLFIRLRQRLLKLGVIITVSAVSMMGVGQSLWGDVGFFGLLGLSLFSLLFFIIPAITDATIGHGEPVMDNT